jgi:hypothetical protein
MSSRRLRLGASVIAASAIVAVSGLARTLPSMHSVHLRGTAYEFNNTKALLHGATVRVAESPKLSAGVGADGRYDLVVPDHAAVTPYIVAPGYHTIYLQTFMTNGEDLANVNFQTPTEIIYRALAALLRVPLDSHGNLVACAIVSTFSTRNVRDVSFGRFIAYGAHGVAGATAAASPALPAPVYFNKDVVPDPSQRASSKDGGVVWTNVPTGVYTISAHDPATRFARFVATCRPGRVVNASPPWGLYQLGLANPARVSARWSVRGAQTVATSLSVRTLPTAAEVRVSCSGRGCPFGSRAFRPRGQGLVIRRVRLRAGDRLEVAVSAHTFNGLVARWVAIAGRAPTATKLCVPLGYAIPRRLCQAG